MSARPSRFHFEEMKGTCAMAGYRLFETHDMGMRS